jgi:tetratricopeptide (TPR) repeat protein
MTVCLRRLFLLLAGVTVWLGPGPGKAQELLPERSDPPVPIERSLAEGERELMAARQLIGRRDVETAARLLESVLDRRPEDLVVMNLLLTCYQQLSRLDQAEALARRMLERNPEGDAYHLRLAEILIDRQKTEEGTEVYRAVIDLIRPFERYRFAIVMSSLKSRGLNRLAMTLIDSLRVDQGDPSLFAMERGEMLEATSRFSAAADEYCLLLNDTVPGGTAAERRLLTLLEFPEAAPVVESVLVDGLAGSGGTRRSRLLALHYLKTGQFDRAFDIALRQDSLDSTKGRALVNFLNTCFEREHYDQVIRMAEHIFATYGTGPFLINTAFRHAEALTRVGRYDEALAAYRQLREDSRSIQFTVDALSGIGDLYLDYLHDYPLALVYFDSVLTGFGDRRRHQAVRRKVPLCHFRRGEFRRAHEGYEALLGESGNDEDTAEEALYYLGLLKLAEGAYDSSAVIFRRLIVEYPRGFFVNDVLPLVMAIDESKESPSLLKTFSSAVVCRARLLPDSAAVHWRALVANGPKNLAAMGLYRLASHRIEQADSSRAAQLLTELIEGYPDAHHLPYAVRMKADILAARPETAEAARLLYRRILQDYPEYPFASEVRESLRRLEEVVPVG